jgi:(p)ppGpp synthase/HD superfamily hydrolase
MAYSYAVEQAIRAASILHKDHIRKGSVPYAFVTHPFAVAMIVSDYANDENTIVAALLHDALEDTDYTEKELEEDFGGAVKDIVLSITQPPLISSDRKGVAEQKKQFLKQLKNASQSALIILSAEKIHNMRSVIEDYYENHSEFMADFGSSLADRLMFYQELSNTLNRSLKNDILAEFNNVFTEYKHFLNDVERKRNEI